MSNGDLLIEEIKTLPDDYMGEVLDFVGYLKGKAEKKQNGCPICDQYRDPQTGELRFNAEVTVAFEEGDAMLRGDIPTEWHKSVDDLDKVLYLD